MAQIPKRCIENKMIIDNAIRDINNIGIKLENNKKEIFKILFGNGKKGLETKIQDNEKLINEKINIIKDVINIIKSDYDKKISELESELKTKKAVDKTMNGILITAGAGIIGLLIKLIFGG